MPLYEYETIPQSPEEPVARFEIRQSIKDEALTKHPDTGQAVRRVISGGLGYIGGKPASSLAPRHLGSCGSHHE